MTTPKHLPTGLLGTALIALGAMASSASATTITGFATFGDMMAGMRVTANFQDGTSNTAFWGNRGYRAGGVSGAGWSLAQSGNSFDSPWTLSNTGRGLTSLVISAISGNTVFDVRRDLDLPNSTPGSADGWSFQVLSGQSPTNAAYTDPIDISRGDLFGTLSLYWTGGFQGAMQFRADTDNGAADDPVRPLDPAVTYAPPTLTGFAVPTQIYEGQSATATLYATDPGTDAITFLLNGQSIGTDYGTSGTRGAISNLGVFADEGVFNYTGQARDEDGNVSNAFTQTVTVLNVAPTIARMTRNLTIKEGDRFAYSATATDPGVNDVLTYKWDINGDGRFGDRRGQRGRLSYADEGVHRIGLQVSDGDGGFDYGNFRVRVENVAPTIARITRDLIVNEGDFFNFRAEATDPGIHDVLSYNWDLDADGIYDNFTGQRGRYSFDDEGNNRLGLQVADGDGGFDYGRVRVQVRNIAPTITQLTENLVAEAGAAFDFGAIATDPGVRDLLSFDWDLDNDGVFGDVSGSTGQWTFNNAGNYTVGLRVSDGDGGFTYGSFGVTTVETVPEPTTPPLVLAVMAGAALIIRRRWRRRGINEGIGGVRS